MKSKFRLLRTPILPLSTITLCFIAAGCQSAEDRVYEVTGKVVFADDSPAKFGIIEFRSASQTPEIVRSKIQKDGTFQVRTKQGKHQVIIIQVVGNPRGRPKIAHSHGLEVDDKYRDYKTSGLEIDVQSDAENFFELLVDSK